MWTDFVTDYLSKASTTKKAPSNKRKNVELDLRPKNKLDQKITGKKRPLPPDISVLHQRYKTMTSANLHATFKENPTLWEEYHHLAEKNDATFDESDIPRNTIINRLDETKTRREKIVVDMGCGKAHISRHFAGDARFKFINYDHITTTSKVIECDISKLPLESESVDICILSMAMWGSNCKEYISEAHRVLDHHGELYIMEPTRRWTAAAEDDEVEDGTSIEGEKLKSVLINYGFHIIAQKINKFALFECIKI
jgi:SAM-dependent methyltransferase